MRVQTQVGCLVEQGVLWLPENKAYSVSHAVEASCWGKAKERKSVSKSPGEGGQDKYTQPREQEGWKIPDAEASLHYHDLTKGLGRGGRERKMPGRVSLPAAL